MPSARHQRRASLASAGTPEAAATREAVRRALQERDRLWQARVDNMKLLVRDAVRLHLPQDRDRDPRVNRFVNALYAGIVRTLGPL